MFEIILHASCAGWILDPERIPAALFVGVFNFSTSQLDNGRYLLTLIVALMAPWLIALGLNRQLPEIHALLGVHRNAFFPGRAAAQDAE
ncbi:MAG: hypothetical protein ABSH09_06070 [Bryobacteraceae bacterium]